jgi:hypothetical protein
MIWSSEADMVTAFVNNVKSKHPHHGNGVIVFQEADTNYGRPDVMLIEYDRRVFHRRRNSLSATGTVSFSPECAYAMAYLSQREWTEFECLQKFLSCRKNKLRSIIDTLATRDLVAICKGSVCARSVGENFMLRRVLVFEAKLSKWRDAITQAERHLWFTGASYVILPTKKRTILDRATLECANRGVGLISFSEDGSLVHLIEPADMKIYNTYLSWLINERVFQ